ncbi:MAG: Ig-like domain-containing protein [Bacilli bacterium]
MEEFLDFDKEEKRKVGRPRLADNKQKKKSLIFASVSFFIVICLMIIGYGSMFGFGNFNFKAEANIDKNVLISDINAISKTITIKSGTSRKIYLTIKPSVAGNKKLSYKSNNEKIATVDKEGIVTGNAEGTTKVEITTMDSSNISTSVIIKVIKDASGKCEFTSVSKASFGIKYNLNCDNAKVAEIQYRVGKASYQVLNSKKTDDLIELSKEQLAQDIDLKVVYNANSSKIDKYAIARYNPDDYIKKGPNGSCGLKLSDIKKASARYDTDCTNASITKIAYKIGDTSYIGVDISDIAGTIKFAESDETRVLYFKIEYFDEGSETIKQIVKNGIIEKGQATETKSTEVVTQ